MRSLVYLEELLTRHRVLGVFPRLGKEWIVSFTLRLASLSGSGQYCNVIHLTQNGDVQAYGDRIAAVFLGKRGSEPTYKEIRFSSGINGRVNKVHAISLIPEGEKPINIEIHQRYLNEGKYRVLTMLNGKQLSSNINEDARQFKKVKVYVGNPWMISCPGYIKNLAITNFT